MTGQMTLTLRGMLMQNVANTVGQCGQALQCYMRLRCAREYRMAVE